MVLEFCPEPRLDPPELEAAVDCDCCGSTLYWGNTWYEVGGLTLCPDCVERKTRWAKIPEICSNCGKKIEVDDLIVVIGDSVFCDDCVAEIGAEC